MEYSIRMKKRNRTWDTKGNSNLEKWDFYGFSTSHSKRPPNLTLRLTSSCHPVLTKQLDVTLLKNKSDETRNNEHSFFRAQNEIVEKR